MLPGLLISKLRKIAVPEQVEQPENCAFCNAGLYADHRHLVDMTSMKFICTCEMCIILKVGAGKYKTLPNRFFNLTGMKMPDDLWSDFRIPVNMAFFVLKAGEEGAVAYYPAPTGATESKLKMEPWQKLTELNPRLQTMTLDLEALLVNRLGDENQYFIVPIDNCYRLIGMIRKAWKGIFGGSEVNNIINKFFAELKEKSTECPT